MDHPRHRAAVVLANAANADLITAGADRRVGTASPMTSLAPSVARDEPLADGQSNRRVRVLAPGGVTGKLGASLPRRRDLEPRVAEIRGSGHPLQRIADALDARGQSTRRGADRSKVQVPRALARIQGGTTRLME